MTTERPLLLRALAGEATPRPPAWFMRQAGRYMADYRALRARVSFLELCADGDLCAEVTLQPLRRFPFDAGIVFSDILVVLQAMGMDLRFGAGHGPELPTPLRDAAAIDALRPIDPARDLPAPLHALRVLRTAADVPVLGFAGAPFTLACYAVEGGGSKEWERTKSLMWSDPAAFGRLLDRLADAVGDHLQAQVEAGAAAVQLFDTWAGILPEHEWARWALPAARRALSRVKGVPTLYFTKDSGILLHRLGEVGASAVALDWRPDIGRARATLGAAVPVQGNLDPVRLLGPEDGLRAEVARIIRAAGPQGFVFNLGHGILPRTPESAVDAALSVIRGWSWT